MSTSDIVKWSVPLTMAASIFGGSAWLTTTHNMVEENTREIRELETDFKELTGEANKLNQRLGRIEEKLDFIVKMFERRRSPPH